MHCGTPPGVEAWLPLFFDRTATLFDYLAPAPLFALHPDLPATVPALWQEA